MPYDFRPYIRTTKPTGGGPGKGVYIKLDDLYVFPDGHGNICAARDDERGLPGLNQPFADAYQGIEIIAGILRAMTKQAKASEVKTQQDLEYPIGAKVLIDGNTPAEIYKAGGTTHRKVRTADGGKVRVEAGRVNKAG